MATKDNDKAKVKEVKDEKPGREQLDLGEVEELAGGAYDRNKPIKLPELG